MNPEEYLRVLRRARLLIIGFVILGLLVGSGYVLVKTPEYQADSTALVSTNGASSITDLTQGGSYLQQQVKSYAQVAVSPYVLTPVINQLNLGDSAKTLADRVSSSAPLDTAIITVTVTDRSAVRAARIANAITRQLSTAVQSLTPDTGTDSSPVRVTQIQPALAPEQPSAPIWWIALPVGALVGLLLGLALAILRNRFDTVIRDVADLHRVTTGDLIGAIGFDPAVVKSPLLLQQDNQSRRSEEFKALRTNLAYIGIGHSENGRAFVVTSSIPSEGKTTTVANLAIVLAQAGTRTLVIDADMRRPKLETYLGLDGQTGLSDVLIGAVSLRDAIQTWGPDGLSVLPSGRIPPNPSELLQSRVMKEMLDELRAQYDVVLIDSPPLLPVTDAAVIAPLADGALIVCGLSRLREEQLRSTFVALQNVDAKVLGLIATMVPRRGSSAYDADYGYYTNLGSGTASDQAESSTSPLINAQPQ